MTAQEKFKRGDRVVISELGAAKLIMRSTFTGTVIGFGRDQSLVKILPDGKKNGHLYHMNFLDHEPTPTEAVNGTT